LVIAMSKIQLDLTEALSPTTPVSQVQAQIQQLEWSINDLEDDLEYMQERLQEKDRQLEQLKVHMAEREQEAHARTKRELGQLKRRETMIAKGVWKR